MDRPYPCLSENWWVARGQDRRSNSSAKSSSLYTLRWQALQERLLYATPKICYSLRSKIHNEGNPRRHMWEPCWGAIPSVQSPKVRLLLANHENKLHGVRPQMRKGPVICTKSKAHLEELTSMNSQWPFTVWGIDLIGWLPKERGSVQYTVVAVDYFTK